MSILSSLFDRDRGRAALVPLYRAIVDAARDPGWYVEGHVPDTLDGRFDMLAALVALALIRMEQAGDAGQSPAVMLTEVFVDDMDGQLRQEGVGDIVVGKHVGRMMGALGGRISAYRESFEGEALLEPALVRNLYRGQTPGDAPLAYSTQRLTAIFRNLAALSLDQIVAGEFPSQ